MSRRRKAKKRIEKERTQGSPSTTPKHSKHMQTDSETLQLGPITIKRNGRALVMRSDWLPGEHEEFMENLRHERPKMKQDVDAKIGRLSDLVKTYDARTLLAEVSLANLLGDPEEYREITHTGSEAKVELLMSIATAFPLSSEPQYCTPEVHEEVSKLLDQILWGAFWYYGAEMSERDGQGIEREIRLLLLGNALGVRGDAYWIHLRQTFLEVYVLHDEFLSREWGFTAEQFLESLEYAERIINARLQHNLDALVSMKDIHSRFVTWSATKRTESSDLTELIKAFRVANAGISNDMDSAMAVLASSQDAAMLAVAPRNEVDRHVFESIACRFGDNRSFLEELRGWHGWPLNPSIVYDKPIVVHEGRFYFFHIPLTLRSVGHLVEQLMTLRDPHYHSRRFLPARDSYLEEKSMELLGTLLPGSRMYRNLYYPVSAVDKTQWVETDGVVLFDSAFLVVETKAEKLSASARRGSILRLRDDLEDIVGEAHSQGMRTLSYLRESDEVAFYNRQHKPVLRLRSADYSDLFAIAVSFEPLGFLSAQLDPLEKLGVVKGREWPWAVYFNDLRAMSEIIEHPVHFIHYLKHRIPLNDMESFKAADELDILMLYLKEGLWMDNPELADKTAVSLVGYSEDLDAYYLFRDGLRSECPKPRQQMPGRFEALIRALESSRPPGFVAASLALLDCSEETRLSIAEQVERTETAFAGDHKPHTARFMLSDGKSAILLVCLDYDRVSEIDRWVKECVTQSGLKNVTLISWLSPLQSAHVKVKNYRFP